MMRKTEAVQERDGKWYWWDECWVDETGPFDTKAEAQEDCNRYWRSQLKEEVFGLFELWWKKQEVAQYNPGAVDAYEDAWRAALEGVKKAQRQD